MIVLVLMRMTSLAQMDKKGRITIPKSIRDSVGVREGMYTLLVAELEARKIMVVPFADPGAKLFQFEVEIPDVPGSLARIARVLAELGVDLLSTESRTLERGKLAEWMVIADLSRCDYPVKKIREKITKDGAAKSVRVSEYRG